MNDQMAILNMVLLECSNLKKIHEKKPKKNKPLTIDTLLKEKSSFVGFYRWSLKLLLTNTIKPATGNSLK